VPADAEQLRPRVVLAPERGEPLWAAAQDGGGDGDGLHVGDGGGAAVEADVGGERGLEAGLALGRWVGVGGLGWGVEV